MVQACLKDALALISFESLQFIHGEYLMGKSNFLLYLGGEKVTLVVIILKRSLLSLLIQQRASLIVFMIKRILAAFLRWRTTGEISDLEGEDY